MTLTLIFISYFFQTCGPRERVSTPKSESTKSADTVKSASELKIATSHIFFENSGSMNGYLNGAYDLKVVLSRLAFALQDKSDNQKFYFYNTRPHPFPPATTTAEFIETLTPQGIRVGDVSTSNLNSILEGVLSSTEENDIGILVTDGIYSINSTAGGLLGQLRVASEGTYSEFRKRLSRSNLQTVVIKLLSHFTGTYYSAGGSTAQINQNRPYYIWLFGAPDRIDRIKDDFKITELPGYVNHVIFRSISTKPPYYSVNTAYKLVGSFKPVRSRNTHGQITAIEDISRRKNQFQFSVEVDMSDVPVEDDYLLDIRNYKVNNKDFKVAGINKVSALNSREAFSLGKSATHLITLKTDRHPKAEIEISLSNNLPHWISETSSEDDSNIIGDTVTTYGFRFLVDGIVRAYGRQNTSGEYFQLDILIND